MSSILTNSSALTALQNLAATQKSLQTTQNQISTGLKVASSADNASYWSIASTMKSDNGALGAVKTSLSQSAAMLSFTNSAVNNVISVMNQIKNDLVTARQPGADLDKIGTDIAQATKQLTSIVNSSTYSGVNLFDGSQATLELVSSFDRDATGATSVGKITMTTAALTGTGAGATAGSGILEGGTGTAAGTGTDFTGLSVTSATTTSSLDTFIADADKTLASLQDYNAKIGATQTRVGLQQSFVSAMSDALTNGVSALVDADMNEASTRLQALQTQQQLGVQSLAIANQNSQMILKLFG
ncbi:MAG TPA: flagellin [Rhodoblastus sp.]|nr:flagellin [Rhodoblastus sp.]